MADDRLDSIYSIPDRLADDFSDKGRLMALQKFVHFPIVLLAAIAVHSAWAAEPGDHPLPREQRESMTKELKSQLSVLTEAIKENPKSVRLYSRRGDVLFFLARFKESVADYEKMVELDSDQDSSHWRRGIARFYAKQYKEAAHQFEIYHSFDDVDRENGIWRYFSQYKAYGKEKAKQGLLKYKKDDRQPFPSVYRLFSGDLSSEEVLAGVRNAEISKTERFKREFYAFLYVGLNHALEGRDKEAIVQLRAATANRWGPEAGFGPNYMWHVGRLHYELLIKKQMSKPDSKEELPKKSEPKKPAKPAVK